MIIEHQAHEVITHGTTMLRWIPFLPLVGAAINFLLGTRIQKRFGRAGVALIACLLPLASFALSVRGFFELKALPAAERLFIDHNNINATSRSRNCAGKTARPCTDN